MRGIQFDQSRVFVVANDHGLTPQDLLNAFVPDEKPLIQLPVYRYKKIYSAGLQLYTAQLSCMLTGYVTDIENEDGSGMSFNLHFQVPGPKGASSTVSVYIRCLTGEPENINNGITNPQSPVFRS